MKYPATYLSPRPPTNHHQYNGLELDPYFKYSMNCFFGLPWEIFVIAGYG